MDEAASLKGAPAALAAETRGAVALTFDEADREAFHRLNQILRRAPRVRLTGWRRAWTQALVRLRTLVADRRVRPTGVSVETRVVTIAGRQARVRILKAPGPLQGVHVDIHGGGWTIGSAAMDDPINLPIVKECGVAVVSVDYRLATRVRLPEVIDDCETALAWVLASPDFAGLPLTLGGESAGAHLALSTALRLRDKAAIERLAGLVLFYGAYDLSGTPSARRAGPETLILHGPTLADLVPAVTGLRDLDRLRDPAISPLYADLHGLPPALMIVGTNDPLQDDTFFLHTKWQSQSGNALLVTAPDAPHAFNRLGGRPAQRTNAFVRAWIKARLAALSDSSTA
ncbi:Acetyl esterase/lipase [Arboricoccus pini]|uniref:Acetyl esterase/lipase n=1 Tax=Arboricoccus pini TaxID=1963835 RepID=A0A212PXP5_9PROT|nr:alpha/beta hydrolase [Arboricoccus pini]SNB51834.1 Acetyl esterase/lipase [Arboricoccus pini]